MIYLGTLGRMVALKCPAQQQVSADDRYVFDTTLEGKRKAHVRPVGRRTWSLQTSEATTPADQAAILSFVEGQWGAGPFYFVSADAPVTNLLTPAASLCQEWGPKVSNLRDGGPVDLGSEGWSGASITSDAPTVFGNGQEIILGLDPVPVRAGDTITASVWARRSGGSGRLRVYWYGPNSLVPISVTTSATVAGDQWTRLEVSATAPAGAVGCRLIGYELSQVTRPAVTWGSGVLPWAVGEGCPRAVLHAASRSLVMAVRGSTYASVGYTITEVG